MSAVGDVINRPGGDPIRLVGVLNGLWAVSPLTFGGTELLSHEEAYALGLAAPGSESDAEAAIQEAERQKTAEAFRAWQADHPETHRAAGLREQYGEGPREGSPEAFFAEEAAKAQAVKPRGRRG